MESHTLRGAVPSAAALGLALTAAFGWAGSSGVLGELPPPAGPSGGGGLLGDLPPREDSPPAGSRPVERPALRAAWAVREQASRLDLELRARRMVEERGAVSCYWDYSPAFGRGPFRNVICLSVGDAVLHDLVRIRLRIDVGGHRRPGGLDVDAGRRHGRRARAAADSVPDSGAAPAATLAGLSADAAGRRLEQVGRGAAEAAPAAETQPLRRCRQASPGEVQRYLLVP